LQQHAAPRGGMKEAEIHSTGPGLTVQISETTSVDAALVQAEPLDRGLGRVRATGAKAAL
ncbi:MAG: hypothetical protein OEL76_12365, partial [Siculibacillus sp.]|nr:hypothetical protein [Siculibacillus sp.]